MCDRIYSTSLMWLYEHRLLESLFTDFTSKTYDKIHQFHFLFSSQFNVITGKSNVLIATVNLLLQRRNIEGTIIDSHKKKYYCGSRTHYVQST